MKIKRYKKVQKNVSFYVNYFQFRSPFQIIVDGTFCFIALNNKINIKDNVPKYFQEDVKFLTTQCTIIETESLGKKVTGALFVLKQFAIHKCGHEGKPISAANCLLSMIGTGNPNHYIVATQDRDLQEKLRNVPGVPLLYLHQKTPVLENPSPLSMEKANIIKQERFGLPTEEVYKLKRIKECHGVEEIQEVHRKKKRRGGPNPLSCKKKKRKVELSATVTNGNKSVQTKIKKKIRIPKHIKELIKENK